MTLSNDLSGLRVLVTPRSFREVDDKVKKVLIDSGAVIRYNTTGQALDSRTLKEELVGVHGYIAGLDEVTDEALSKADELRVIARYGVGTDNIDWSAVHLRGIVVTNTPGANSESVAEFTVTLMLSLVRRLPEMLDSSRDREWRALTTSTLEAMVVGVLGFGAVGRSLVERLRNFRCRILVCDHHLQSGSNLEHDQGFERVSEERLLTESDIVSLHIQLNDANRGIVNRDFLRRMKTGSFLVNTARGELVDERDLIMSLEDGRLGGAALDVFPVEPLPIDSPLHRFRNVIITPHVAAHTKEAINAAGKMAIDNCLAVLRGELPINPVEVPGESSYR